MEILDAVEYHLRKFAVSFGSPIVYTSVKRNVNIELLLDYIKYLFFSIPFRHHSSLGKDSLFIPIGYDNSEIIQESYSTVKEKPFDIIAKKPQEGKQNIE